MADKSDSGESLGTNESKSVVPSNSDLPVDTIPNGFGENDEKGRDEKMEVTEEDNSKLLSDEVSENNGKDSNELKKYNSSSRRPSTGRMRSRSKSTNGDEEVKTKPETEDQESEQQKMKEDLASTSSHSVKEEGEAADKTTKPESSPVKDEETAAASDEKDDEEDFLGFENIQNNYTSFSVVMAPYNLPKEDLYLSVGDQSGSTENGPVGLLNPYVQLKSTRVSAKKSQPKSYDISSNPEYRKPFEYGWVRELVYRNTNETSLKRNADVYYYTPNNKKVRSTREVAEHLLDHEPLTIENFTFWKEPIGIDDPSKEIIRGAKGKTGPPRLSEEDSSGARTPKAMSKAKSPKGSLHADHSPPSSSPLTPRIVFKSNANIKKNNAKKLNLKGEKKRKSAGPDDSEMDIDDLVEWSPEPKPQAREVCSIECPPAMGLIPTLKCVTCLCLYHPECVALPQAKHRQIHSYVCKNCQSAKVSSVKMSLPPPPPLTPIQGNSQKKVDQKSGGQNCAPPQRGQSIVDAMTTWLPPTSSIQVGGGGSHLPSSRQTTPLDSNPQSLISVQGKKFILIPKHNVVKLDNVPPGEGDTSIMSQGQHSAAANPPGVLLVPCTSTTSSPGTFVVQSGNNTAPTYIVTSPHSAPQLSSLQLSNGYKRASSEVSDGSPPEKAAKVKGIATTKASPKNQVAPAPPPPPCIPMSANFMMNINAGYSALLHSFQYLKVYELLRASCVSRMWRHIASHPSLWETVKMKNSRVGNWDGFGTALRNNGTKCLDLKKMLLPETADATLEMWNGLAKAIATVPTLKKVDLGRCVPEALQLVTAACPQLESIVSLTIRGQSLDATCFQSVQNLQELRIKSVGGFDLTNLSGLKSLTRLKHLALTTVKNLKGIEDVLNESLETLELGECGTLSEELATVTLPKLINLKRLRLEKGQGSSCPTTQIITAVANLENLKQLELINFDIKPGFDKVLAKCVHLRTLLIIPTYVTQSATTNHVVMGGVSKLSGSLTYFIWGLTLELLRVTDLFIDQVEAHKTKSVAAKKGSGDSIPILKPLSDETIESNKDGQTTSQVDILALPKLQKVLSTLLPTTKIKILKVPFSATWRQTVDI